MKGFEVDDPGLMKVAQAQIAVAEDCMSKLMKMILQWHEVVRQVAVGYRYTIYNYHNDLSVREIIQKDFLSVGAATDNENELLRKADMWFKEATFEVSATDAGLSGMLNRYPI